MRRPTVFPQLQVPPIVGFVEAMLLNCILEKGGPLLAYRPANELPNSGYKEVEARDGLPAGRAAVVQAHVERLQRRGVVRDEDGPADVLLCVAAATADIVIV